MKTPKPREPWIGLFVAAWLYVILNVIGLLAYLWN